jgi:outer membrane protein assembly factor BamD (BamD/ComL family)
MNWKLFPAALILLLLIVSCSSAPPEIPPDLSQPEFFQLAQRAKDSGKYDTAIAYYQEFITKFPDDQAHVAAAEYEIAFIHYQISDYSTAKRLFEDLLNKYENSGGSLPERFKILSEKILRKAERFLEEENSS